MELDIYVQYILYLQQIESINRKTEKCEKHRIVPGHQKGTYNPTNVVFCTFQQHRLAHFYRYLTYQQKGDLVAFRFMSNQTEEGRRLLASFAGKIGGVSVNLKNKRHKYLFFDVNWQKKHGYRNAGKRNVNSGTLARVNQQITENNPEQRSHAGKLGGKARVTKQREQKNGSF
jgi:hypothetical protein